MCFCTRSVSTQEILAQPTQGPPSPPVPAPPPPPPNIPPPNTQSAQISATTKRGCRPWAGSPWGPGNSGADLLLPLPAPTELGPDWKQAQRTPPPPPLPPEHAPRTLTAGRHVSRSLPSRKGRGRQTTSTLGSGTHMVTQQVVLLSQRSEDDRPMNGQVDFHH